MPSLEKLKAWADEHQSHCEIEARGKGPCTCDRDTKMKLIAFVEAFDDWIEDDETCEPDINFDPILKARKALENA